jgi:ElaB/YqjD/DUF883 family membrane-anchored ribosome-binding protein
LGGTLGDVKGAAAGALSVLGTKAAGAVQNVMSSNGDAKGKARNRADVAGNVSVGDRLLQLLGRRTDEAAQTAMDGGWNIKVDVNDVPRLLRGTALVATGLGTIFAPGSALDVSTRVGGEEDQLAEQARQGIDTAANVTQQRIKDIIDLAKEALASFSEALQEGIETAERQAQQTLEETEALLAQTPDQVGEAAQQAVPRKKGGTVRWLFYGLLVGGVAAFLSSPFSGPIGERIMNLRRDLGLGGAGSSASQYWPSQPQQSAPGTPDATAGPQAAADGDKTESWRQSSDVKESTDKS